MAVGNNLKGIIDRDGVKHAVPAGGGGIDPSIIERLNEKTDKVNPSLEGHLAVYDEDGNLTDGGEKSQFAAGIKLYEDSYASFEDSNIIGTILSAGIHQILYIPTTNNPSTYHVLLVRYYSMKPSPTSSIKKAVEQCLIDYRGVKTRFRLFNDDEHTDPYGNWSDWEVLTPEVGNYITEDSSLPVTSAAIYAALAGKAPSDHGHVKIEDITEEAISSVQVNGDEIEFFIEDMSGEEPIEDTVTLTLEKMGNFKRALVTPELANDPTKNTKLITAGKVLELLAGKADADKISHLSDITLLVLKLAAAAEIEDLSWDTIDSAATYYSVTSLEVDDSRAYSQGDICKISNGTTTVYTTVSGFTNEHVVNFDYAFATIQGPFTISKLS